MRTDAWNSDIRNQVNDKNMPRLEERLKNYKVYNNETGDVYIDTKSKVVADGCLRRMRAKYGKKVSMEISQ